MNESSGRLDRTYTRCHPLASVRGGSIDPSHPRLHGMVHRSSVPGLRVLPHLRDTTSPGRSMDPLGFEPRASALQRRRSATELWARPPYLLALVVHRCPIDGIVFRALPPVKWAEVDASVPVSGGDPAADSPTATLLRLKPPCEAQIRPSHDGLIRTSLGCFDARCVQGAGTYSPRAYDTRLLPNPAS